MIGEKCAVYGCKNISIAKGLCDKHRKRKERHGHILETRASDWGSREKHSLYKAWCHLRRFHYPKGTVCKEWVEDFWLFANEVGEHNGAKKYILSPKDDSKPLGPNNWYWRERIGNKTPEQKERLRAFAKAYWKANPERGIDQAMRRYYGITFDDYKEIHESQNGLCAICNRQERSIDHKIGKVRRLAVDHCHKTNKVRGLLCADCNRAIGMLNDDISILQSAIEYLKKHQT